MSSHIIPHRSKHLRSMSNPVFRKRWVFPSNPLVFPRGFVFFLSRKLLWVSRCLFWFPEEIGHFPIKYFWKSFCYRLLSPSLLKICCYAVWLFEYPGSKSFAPNHELRVFATATIASSWQLLWDIFRVNISPLPLIFAEQHCIMLRLGATIVEHMSLRYSLTNPKRMVGFKSDFELHFSNNYWHHGPH